MAKPPASPTTPTAYAILGLLSLRPMSGYDIRGTIPQSIGHFWRESYGQIYPTLARLENDGLIRRQRETKAGRPQRNVYSLAARGQKELAAWLGVAAAEERPRNEVLLKLFFGAQLSPEANSEQIVLYRDRQTELLAAYVELDRSLSQEHIGEPSLRLWRATLSYCRHQSEAAIRWCDETVILLSEMQQEARRAARSILRKKRAAPVKTKKESRPT